ncbi:MAG: NUDIX domain-containing protein [Pseudomonadota bacterium]
MTSLFLYGTLRHLPLLSVVLGRKPNGVPAQLQDHCVMKVRDRTYPALHKLDGQVAEGLLIAVTEPERARLDYYEAAHDFDLRPACVETADGARAAHVYFPSCPPVATNAAWSLEDWALHHGAPVTLAAKDVMALMDAFTAEEIGKRYNSILARAHSKLRAADSPAPMDVRKGPGGHSVTVEATRHPYNRFFAVAEQDLRFPRFDGGQSRTVTRAAFIMSDAVTVLPYDPERDRVLLIEQFRFGPYMRGDPRPWSLEPVAGRIDPGETPEDAARREAVEEAHVSIGALHEVAAYYPSPGGVTEFLWSYVGIADLPDDAAGLGGVAEEEEDILGHILSFSLLMELIATGEASNAPLILTGQWLSMHRDRLRKS